MELIGKILDRYEADYEDQRPGLVRDATTLLWAARGGLSEAELLDALGSGGEPLPQAYWSPLYLAADPLLIHRGGLIGFSHDYCLTAIEKRYLTDPPAALGAHQRLAHYFQTRELGPRKVDELPWQLVKANLWQTLADTLSNMAFFSAAWNRSEFDVKWYWAEVQKNSGANPLSVYSDLLSHPEKLETGGRWLAYLLSDAGYLNEAAQLASSLIVQCRRRNDREELQRTLDDASVHLRMIGRLNEAWAVHLEAESLAQSLSNLYGRASCLGNGATILIDQDDLDGALRLLKEQESICRTFQDLAGVGSSLGNQALVLHRKGDVQGAVAIYREEEKIARRMNDAFAIVTTLSNRASALASLHDPSSALSLLEEAEGICRALNARVYLQAVLGGRARALAMLQRFDESLEIALQQERLCQELGHQEGLAQSRG
jgi:tetratricopeptide (TPR) repeat protein